MNPLIEADIVDVLSKINDLSRGKDIYSLGIVTNIHIKDNNVQITLEVESHRANAFEVIRNKVIIVPNFIAKYPPINPPAIVAKTPKNLEYVAISPML